MASNTPWRDDRIREADIRRLRSIVARRASRLLGRHDLEDLVGEILADAVAASSRTGISVAKLAGVGANRPRYYARARSRAASRLAQLAAPPPADDDEADAPPVIADDVAEALALRDLIDRLPDGLRQAFVLCALDGATLEEASTLIGVPVSTLHRRLGAARDVLQAGYLAAEAA